MVHPGRTAVVIVGGGPVGMLLAAELGGYGVRTLVLEADAATSERPKATTLHARTVQCLARRGYLPAPEPTRLEGSVSSPFHFAGLPGLQITAPASEPDPILKRPQAELERLFETRARARGAKVLREHRVVELHQGTDGMRIAADGPHGRTFFESAYVVGADGARSTVRKLAGIESESWPATVSAMMGLVRVEGADAPVAGWHRTPRGWVTVKEDTDGTHIRTLNYASPRADCSLDPSLEELRRETSWILGQEIAMSAPRWLSRFSDFTRLARTYRAGRVLLAGDAAHVHFPIGGQGLSTGLLDVLNLGWKLALTVRGEASEGLLDSYDAERRPAARRVVDNTRAQVTLMDPDARFDALRSVFGGLLAKDGPHGPLSSMISAQDTVVAGSPGDLSRWEGRFLPNLPLRTEAGPTDVIRLLQDGRMLLLLFGVHGDGHEKAAQKWAHVLRVVRAERVADVSCNALLLRPDGYVAWASDGDDLDATLAVYLASGRTFIGTAP
ncbi:FAD-dependent monooxygenase [Streptomyces violascens]|uniref:FAD-dependent monooxygenase n=1 Tax=Streptomyces violascens TaxID=67381 RepID=UPI00365BBFF2